MSHGCAKPGCVVPVADNMLACKRHWYDLDVDLRARINIAWRGRKMPGGEGRHLEAVAEAMRVWMDG